MPSFHLATSEPKWRHDMMYRLYFSTSRDNGGESSFDASFSSASGENDGEASPRRLDDLNTIYYNSAKKETSAYV